MPFENNDTLQKWHMIKTPPEIGKCDTNKRWFFTNMSHLPKRWPKVTLFAKD